MFMLEMFFHKVGEKDQVFDFLLEEKDLYTAVGNCKIFVDTLK